MNFKKSNALSDTSNAGNIYVVDVNWIKSWTDFLSGYVFLRSFVNLSFIHNRRAKRPPTKINNKALYKKYYING